MLLPTNGIRLSQGEDQIVEFTVTDSSGAVQDLTGARIILSVKADSTDRTPVISKTSDDISQGQIVKALSGQARFYIVSQDTKDLAPGIYLYDIWVKLSSGKKYPVIPTSVFEVTGSITRF
jgi:hypothetical protein